MITIATEVGKYYFTDFISLGSNESAVIDEKLLVLGQLKSLRNAYKTDRLIVSSADRLKVEAEIESKSQTGGGGNVNSVQGEIGDVVLDATEIDLTTGGSIEEKFGELSPVAFTGSYLDLTNRPGGTAVIPSPETIASNLQSNTTEVVNGTTLSVKRSTDANNSLELRSNGLYVPPVVAATLDTSLPSGETGRAPTSYTVYNAFNSNTLRISGSKGEVKLSALSDNRLVDSGTGLYVAPETVAITISPSVYAAVSSSTVYNALTSNTISFVDSKVNVKIENPASSSVQINTSANGISAVLKPTVKLGAIRETVNYSAGLGSRYLSLTNFNVFVIDCGGGSGTVLVNGLNDLDDNQAKTITIIVKNTAALTWGAEFAWVDNSPPTLQPSTTLVVTGIYASNASNATYTAGKILCTFSYFTV